jgi:CRISPR/Cas system-associated endonuclease/helicase Cas3
MADKPGFPVGELGQVFVTTKEGAEGNKEEMVEELHGEEESENSVVKSDLTLKDYASSLYEEAGGLVGEQEDEISLVRHFSLLSDKVAYIIKEVIAEHPLQFELQQFQLVALHALGSGQNVILMAPTGSGKMIVAYLAILVLQKTMNVPEGVGIGCQPLSSIMEERLKKPFIPTGVITMRGGLKSSLTENDGEDDIELSGPVEDFKTGCLKLLLGHAESWMSRTAQDILDSLRENGLVILTIVDEAHIPLADHWDSFRPQLKLVPGQLRGRAVKGAPTLAMTATLTPAEVKELESSLGLRSNTVLLKANPIQEHHKFVR